MTTSLINNILISRTTPGKDGICSINLDTDKSFVFHGYQITSSGALSSLPAIGCQTMQLGDNGSARVY